MPFVLFSVLVYAWLGLGLVRAGEGVSIRGRVVNDWAYQLQGRKGKAVDLTALGETKYDLLVIDPLRDGENNGEISPEEILALRNSEGGSKVVLAYLSIGEAESYRWYFKPEWVDRRGRLTTQAPPWLAAEDPDWAGNFKVRYWDPAWQQLIFGNAAGTAKSSLDRILDQGFDGVYLDIIDAFEYFGPDSRKPERPSAAADMATFVEAIATYARDTRGRSDFVVVPQNGANIVRELDETQQSRFFDAVDAIGAEDTFFYGPLSMNNRWKPQKSTLEDLAVFQSHGKPVLAVDYVSSPAKVRVFYRTARAKGFVPYAGPRALNRVVIHRGFEPD